MECLDGAKKGLISVVIGIELLQSLWTPLKLRRMFFVFIRARGSM